MDHIGYILVDENNTPVSRIFKSMEDVEGFLKMICRTSEEFKDFMISEIRYSFSRTD